MIDARFKVVGLRDGTVEVSWPEGGRMIVANLDAGGALVTPTLLSVPVRRQGERYGADGLRVPTPRKVDLARRSCRLSAANGQPYGPKRNASAPPRLNAGRPFSTKRNATFLSGRLPFCRHTPPALSAKN